MYEIAASKNMQYIDFWHAGCFILIMKEHERRIGCLDGKAKEKEHERRRIQRLDHDHRDAYADRLPALRDHSVRLIGLIGSPNNYRPGLPKRGSLPTGETATVAADGPAVTSRRNPFISPLSAL
jgi:hypothetical protein